MTTKGHMFGMASQFTTLTGTSKTEQERGKYPRSLTTKEYTMKKNDITKVAADDIQNYINDGFTVSLTELTGSYGQYNQLVLMRDRERVVVWLEDSKLEGERWVDTVIIHVSHFELEKGQTTEYGDLHWQNGWKANDVKTYTLYKIDYDWYTTDKEEAILCYDLQRVRYSNRDTYRYEVELEVTDQLLKIARKMKGFKTIKKDNLTVRRSPKALRWTFVNKTSGKTACVGA